MDRDNPHDIFPQDGAAHSFDVVIRGYDRAQVHDVVDRMDGELRVALADKDASAAKAAELASQLSSIQVEIEALRTAAQSAAAPNFESMGARISHMLKLAEEEANDIRRIAHEEKTRSQAELMATNEEGERVRAEAKTEVQRLTEEAQTEARRVTEEAKQSAASTVAEAKKQAEDLNERARVSAEQQEEASKAKVAKIEEDFQLAQKARRAEAARVEQERDQASRRDAQTRIQKAQRKSDDMVAAAEKRVAYLDAQRGELHVRLTQVRELLGGLPEIGTPTEIEPDPAQAKPGSADTNGRAEASGNADAADKGEKAKPETAKSEAAKPTAEAPTDVQGTPPPPPAAPQPAAPSWPVNAPTQAIQIPRQG